MTFLSREIIVKSSGATHIYKVKNKVVNLCIPTQNSVPDNTEPGTQIINRDSKNHSLNLKLRFPEIHLICKAK